MTFTRMHERLRQELLRRIQRGTLSVSLLNRQTGLTQSHISNFLLGKRRFSPAAMDRVLRTQKMDAGDLLPASEKRAATDFLLNGEDTSAIPIVSHHSACSDPIIHPSAILALLPLPGGALQSIRTRAPSTRLTWQRFVAVRVSRAEALPMDPVIQPEALAVVDRHYNLPIPYRPSRRTLFAVHLQGRLLLRYVDLQEQRLVLRPLNMLFPVDLLEVEPGNTRSDAMVGRVVLVLNEI